MVATDIKSIAKEANGFISIASEAVKVAPEYQNIIGNLLGNTIIVDHLKYANELARAIKYRTRIVTLEGDIVNPGGSMTGGGARKSKSILSQKDELTTMRHQLEDYLRQTESFEQQFKELKIKSDQLSELYFEKVKSIIHLKSKCIILKWSSID